MMPFAFSSSQQTPSTVTPFSRPIPRSAVSPAATVIGSESCSPSSEKSMMEYSRPISLDFRLKPHFSGRDALTRYAPGSRPGIRISPSPSVTPPVTTRSSAETR